VKPLPIGKAFMLLEPGPVVLITTDDGCKPNVMTVSWTMVMSEDPIFAIVVEPSSHSYRSLVEQKECVIAIPSLDMLDTAVDLGTCSGRDTDKFAKFGIAAVPASKVRAPLLSQCIANIECHVIDLVERYGMVVLRGIAAHVSDERTGQKMFHAIGDGRFLAEGETVDRREQMRAVLARANRT
jgi:flavin reductase (DIM6/NTAB) family NADH-FMN oxidoreductase RutF